VEVASITLLNRVDSKDEEELGGKELEVYQILVVRVDRTHAKNGKWKNPTKIIKRTKLKEWKLAVLKIVRLREWKLATVTDVTDEGIKVDLELVEDAVLVRVEDNPKKKKRRLRTLKKKYLDVIKETTDLEAVFNEVIKQLVTIKL